MALRWTTTDELIYRLGAAYPSTPATNVVVLQEILAGVEKLIEVTIRSPVALKEIVEWTAPTSDPRLILKWRPVNVEDEDAGTSDPVALVCAQQYQPTTGTALTYGTQFIVYGGPSDDPRFCLEPMLEAIGGAWWGWGGNQTWGGGWTRPPTRLANTLTSDRGRIRVTYWAGWPADAIPACVRDAAYLEAATLWGVRKSGQLYQSESLNGYSYSLGSPGVVGAKQSTGDKFASSIAADMLKPWALPAIACVSPW